MKSQKRAPVLGIDIGGTDTKLGLVHPDGSLLGRQVISTHAEKGPRAAASTIAETARSMVLRCGHHLGEISLCGVGIPGPLSADRTRILKTPNLKSWSYSPIKAILERRLGMRVVIENDANLAMWGEYWLGAARGCDTAVMLTLGTGIGGGMVLGGRLWTGPFGGAAELGHVVVDPKGRRCGCGARGCVEAYASARAIMGQYGSRSMTPQVVFDLARRGDRKARRVVQQAIEALAIALAGLTHVIQPEKIILGGGISQAGRFLIQPLLRRVRERVLSSHRSSVRIVRAQLGNDAGFLGAAGWALQTSGVKELTS